MTAAVSTSINASMAAQTSDPNYRPTEAESCNYQRIMLAAQQNGELRQYENNIRYHYVFA